MLLYAQGSGSQRLNSGFVVLGGNIPSGDRTTVNTPGAVIGTQTRYAYIGTGQGSGLYLGSGIVGGTLAQDDRDDAIIYLSQKRDIAGVASTKLAQSVAGPNRMPATTLSGSPITYPSGFSYISGAPAGGVVVVGSEVYGTSDIDASGRGFYTMGQGGKNPTSGLYPSR